MKVLVLGAGVVGVTTAWYLARLGAELNERSLSADSQRVELAAAKQDHGLAFAALDKAIEALGWKVKDTPKGQELLPG